MSRFVPSRKVFSALVAFSLFALVITLGATQPWVKESPSNQRLTGESSDSAISQNPSHTIEAVDQLQESASTEDALQKQDLLQEREKFAVFRDIQVSWEPRLKPSDIVAPYGPQYEDLRSKALEGDVEAAFSLFRILDECKNAFATEDKLQAAINEFRATHRLRLPEWNRPLRMGNSEDLDKMVDQIEMSYERCYPITPEQKAERERWLKLAADGGSITAGIWYASTDSDPERSMTAALAAWEKGAPQSLAIIGRLQRESYERGEDLRGDLKAFSSLYAYAYLLSDSRNSLSDPRVREAIELMESMKASLHEYQIQEAIQIAVETVKSNSNCCIRF